MIGKISANQRHLADQGWLRAYWLFSFADYYDPNNVQFGALRVFNDNSLQAGTGFPTHDHKEMEVVTIVLRGEVTHRDSLGNKSVVKAGVVQRMSAGMGLNHSEANESTHPAHFYQIWIEPNVHGLKPTYEQRLYPAELRRNALLPVVSGTESGDALRIHADATVCVGDFDPGKSIELETKHLRGIFIYVGSGRMKIGAESYVEGDQARITPEGPLSLKFDEKTSLVVVDIPYDTGTGFD